MRSRFYHSIVGVLLVAPLLFEACEKGPKDSTPQPPAVWDPNYVSIEYPTWFPIMPTPENNPLTLEGIALGRRLYYDMNLHPQGIQSCATCHVQTSSFSSSNSGTSVLAHVNLAWSDAFLWNGKVEGSLEDIMFFEVAVFFQTDVDKLSLNEAYPRMFFEAFGDSLISQKRCADAIAQFVRSITSYDSHYDRYTHGNELPTPDEVMGERIFNSEIGDCFHCHPTPLFTDNAFHNIGLDTVFEGDGQGRYLITDMEADKGAFKTPTLRNIALTPPYMHDGRFSTLEEVIDHYNSGVHTSPSLDPIMTKPGKQNGLELTEEQKAQLLAFLLALTDSTLVNDSTVSAP